MILDPRIPAKDAAEKVGCRKNTVYEWRKRHGLERPKPTRETMLRDYRFLLSRGYPPEDIWPRLGHSSGKRINRWMVDTGRVFASRQERPLWQLLETWCERGDTFHASEFPWGVDVWRDQVIYFAVKLGVIVEFGCHRIYREQASMARPEHD